MRSLDQHGNPGANRAADQIEFPLRVAVCAWCKPKEYGASLGALSHGICPRHFREMKMKLKLQRSLAAGAEDCVVARTKPSRKLSRLIAETAQLRFPFPNPLAAAAALRA